jgi:hypothetical protein
MVIKTIDNKGRLSPGRQYVGKTVMVEVGEDGRIVIALARVIPDREAWLYANPVALRRVRDGLRQAREGEISISLPDVKADAAFAE